MKPAALLLLASLVANAALVAVLALRRGPTTASAVGPDASAIRSAESGTDGASSRDALRTALSSGDAAALEAAGAPADAVRQLAVGRAFARYAEALRGSRGAASRDPRWWRSGASRSTMPREQRQQLWAAQRELAAAVAAAVGEDLGLFGSGTADATVDFLPPAKRDALRRIEQDYAEMMAEYSGPGGVQLPSDREKLKLLREERQRDIAALLSPTELADYELRNSPSAANVRTRYGDAITSEEDFRKVYELQKAFDEKFPREAFVGRVAPDVLQQRMAAERQLQEDMRASLGDEKYAALRRAADSDLRVVDSLASRLNLPATVTDGVAAAREKYAAESLRINSDTSLPPPQRRAEIQALGNRAKAEVSQMLGGEAADAYMLRSTWLNMLQSGMAFSTNPKDAPAGGLSLGSGQSVYPVMPAGAAGAGGAIGVRQQVVNIVGGASGGPAGAGGVLLGPTPTPGAGDGVPIISIIRTETPGHDGAGSTPRPEVTPTRPPTSPPPVPKTGP